MHVQDLVGISGITRVLLVCSCQQGAHPRGRPTPLAPHLRQLWNFKQVKVLFAQEQTIQAQH
jgi:hypothetical protein